MKLVLLMLFLGIFCLNTAFAQDEPVKIDAKEKSQVVDSIAKFMTERYVFPDKGKEMGDLVLANLKKGDYNEITDPRELASKLSEDLLTVNNDRHIGVMYMPERIAMMQAAREDQDR